MDHTHPTTTTMFDSGEMRRWKTGSEDIKNVKPEPNEGTPKSTAKMIRRTSSDVREGGQEHSTQNGQTSLSISTPASAVQSPRKGNGTLQSPSMKSEFEEVVGGDITVKLEPGKAPKLARSSLKKIVSRPPPLFLDLPDSTFEASQSFELIDDCNYANKYLGTTDHALECDCSEEWDTATQSNHACGEESDCINRATKMECVGDCNCGTACQNQRFQRQQYANVAVIKTEKKGYGLRANAELPANTFIFEYIGEVIGEAIFRRRIVQYDEEGIKHFYFMSLNKGEFVDATKKGNLGRFCNHSCNPNCYVDKWVVGDKLRMGIFAERNIAAGEELVFNYNVDRYGADPQPCYCGEPNCTGYIGGKTQTERATKLSTATIEALGIEDGDDWDTAVARKGRKAKKIGEDDEEYVASVQPKSLDEAGVTKVMATLMQCKEKWIAVKLLSRIQRCEEERVRTRVVKMHGYQILNTALTNFIEDANVILQIFDILNMLPRLTRNKIQDSKIERTVEKLLSHEDPKVKEEASAILKIWNALEVAYRIPRLRRDAAAIAADQKAEREERRRLASEQRTRSRSKSPNLPKGPSAPTGPRIGGLPPRPAAFHVSRPAFRRPLPTPLPTGWFAAQANGKTYYYSASGQTTWDRPTAPATQPPPPPKEKTNEQKLQEIINSITSTTTPTEKTSANVTPVPSSNSLPHVRPERKEKWRSYSEEKRKRLYENTLFPHIKHVMDKFKGKLPKEDLKRFAKEVAKKLVSSDFKNKRVENPTEISFKQERNVKKYVKEYFEKAVAKKVEHDRKKATEKKAKGHGINGEGPPPNTSVNSQTLLPILGKTGDEDDIVLSENEIEDDEDDNEPSAPSTVPDIISPGTELKRKREADETPLTDMTPDNEDATPAKRHREDDDEAPPPPPPPPPPPTDENSSRTDFYGTGLDDLIEPRINDNIEEFGITPGGDITGSFTDEALEAVKHASYQEWGEKRWGEGDVSVR